MTSDCYGCITSSTTTKKYCLATEDYSYGYCCDLSNTSDYCTTSNRYLCTDLAQTKSMKWFFCPNS